MTRISADVTTKTETGKTRGRVRIEEGAKRVRAYLGGEVVADTTHPMLVWEKPYYPAYYVPIADVRTELLEADGGVARSPSRGDGHTLTITAGGQRGARRSAALRGLAARGASRPDPARLGRDGRLV